jgi:puromycin-sensitive aminopeptidase
MIYRVLGEKHFQEGLQLYFSRHKYSNTRTIDLWNAWKEVSGKPIDKMMSSWTEQMGFPVLEVLNDPFSTGQVELKQSWFLADGSKETGDDAKVWFCPVIVATDKGEAPVSFLEQKTGKVDCANLAGASFMKVNFGQHVPVRVLYPEPVFKRLVQNLKAIPAEDRIGLLSDTFATCKAGGADPGFIVDLLSGFKEELNHNVWSELSACLGGLEKIILQGLDDDTGAAFQDHLDFFRSEISWMPAKEHAAVIHSKKEQPSANGHLIMFVAFLARDTTSAFGGLSFSKYDAATRNCSALPRGS